MFIIHLQLEVKKANIGVVSENRMFVGPVNLCSYDITKKFMPQLQDQCE